MPPSINSTTFYDIFKEISRLVHSTTDLDEILEVVVWKTTEILGAKGAIIRIHNPDTDSFEVGVSYGLADTYVNKGPVSRETLMANLGRPLQVVVIEDILNDPRVAYPREAWDEGIRMMLDVPLTLGSEIVGWVRVYFDQKRKFSREELGFLASVAQQCACAVNTARLIQAQQSRFDSLALQTEKLSALGRLAAGIAHEINNPLAGILLFSSNLLKKVPAQGRLREGLEVIVRETTRCKSIIQELLEFSRDREPRRETADLNQVIRKALSILDNEFNLHRLWVHSQLAPDLTRISLDHNQMEQVLVNILLNAVQATPDRGTITIESSLDPEGQKAVIEIADTGCGIPPENLPKIFEPFFSTKPKGTGLGLAVSYGIVRNHGGDIKVISRPGQGSRFIIELPRHGLHQAGGEEGPPDGAG